jgi:RNA polymerase sigma factor for flagellar operon FliA
MDWIPRSIRQKQRKIVEANKSLELRTGKIATDEELADELDISLGELETWQGQTNITNIISLDEYMEQGSEGSIEPSSVITYEQPEKILEREELKELLVKTLDTLTEKEKTVIVLYYYEELTLKEISRIIEVSESRVSQLHTKSLQKMKIKLGMNMEVFFSY